VVYDDLRGSCSIIYFLNQGLENGCNQWKQKLMLTAKVSSEIFMSQGTLAFFVSSYSLS
jgi:hypothetical protein